MARSRGSHFVITANRTLDGANVYLRADGTWSERLRDALTIADPSQRDALLAGAARQERSICDPYAFLVDVDDGIAIATTARERIRGTGPTTRLRRPDTKV